MAEFFMSLSTALGWGVAGVYVALGVVGFGIILGIGLGAYAYRRRKNLKQSNVLGLRKNVQFERAKVKNTSKFYNFLKKKFNELFGKEVATLKSKPAKTAKEKVATESKSQTKNENPQIFMQDKMNTELKPKKEKKENEEVEEVEEVVKKEKSVEEIRFSEKDGMDLN